MKFNTIVGICFCFFALINIIINGIILVVLGLWSHRINSAETWENLNVVKLSNFSG